MSDYFTGYIPPVGFYFSVSILEESGSSRDFLVDGSFQEVSGISVKMETQTIKEGGENRYAHKVPGRFTSDDLVLKRGLVVSDSQLSNWCKATFYGGLDNKIELRIIRVALLDANADSNEAIMSWVFHDAYPIQWSISNLNAEKSEIVVESITFAYSHFLQVTEPAGKTYPNSAEDDDESFGFDLFN